MINHTIRFTKKKKSPIKLAAKNPPFFFFFFSDSSHAVEVIKKLECSHIARGSVHEYSLLWGTIQKYGFELLEILLFVNSIVPLLRLYLKKQS